jgi:multiple sugar transport system ATP-binding protein
LLDRKPYELSGGERQRVALARAIVRNPKAFLLDEPLSNIDAKLRVAMRAELIRLQKTLKTTTIYVTHDQVEAMTMADRIAIMNKGKVAQLDEPIRIFDKPADTFVAGFIGSPPMNFFHCSLMEEKEKTKLKTSEFSLSLPSDVAALVKEHGNTSDLILAVRPQNISVSKQRLGDDSFETEVYAVEPLGTETIVDLTVGGQIVKSVCPPTFKASLGEKVWAKIDIAKIHVYDRKTEKLIV